MPLPFVLAGECALAAGEIEHTEESPGVCLSGVTLEGGRVLERCVLAGFAREGSCLGLGKSFGVPGALW